jgi:exosortase
MLIRSERNHLLFLSLWLGSLAVCLVPLKAMAHLSMSDPRYSHLLVIPVISAALIYRNKESIFSRKTWYPKPGLALLAIAAVLFEIGRSVPLGESESLSLTVLAIVVFWTTTFIICYGARSFRDARFALLFLLLMVPVPSTWMDNIIVALQTGSTELCYALFRLGGVPVYRHGFMFDLPVVGIEVAKECSSVHSACALLITGLLIGHLALRSLWSKIGLTLLTPAIAVLGNAVRIFLLWWLAAHVNMEFLTGNLHHRGGAVFAIIPLCILLALLAGARRLEQGGPVRGLRSETAVTTARS